MHLAGRTVLVTGATGGLGGAIARALSARGARLVLSARRPEPLERMAAELRARGVPADLADPQAADRLVAHAGDVDVLVANAALPAVGRLHDVRADEVDAALEVNLRAPVRLAHALAPRLVRERRGHLVFVSSLAGKAPATACSLYTATKFGLRGFALALREDLRPHGVGVSVVLPAFIRDAGMFADTGVPLPRGVGTRAPDDVARAVVRAIERDTAEVVVAAVAPRVAAALTGAAPAVGTTVMRRLPGANLADQVTERMRSAG